MNSPLRQLYGRLHWQVFLCFVLLVAASIISNPVIAQAGKLAAYQVDTSALQAYSFVAITNTSSSAATITVQFGAADTDQATIGAGDNWIISAPKGMCLSGASKGKPADFGRAATYTGYQNMEFKVMFDYSSAKNKNVATSHARVNWSSVDSALASGLDTPDRFGASAVIINVQQKANSDSLSLIQPCTNLNATQLPDSIRALDEKIAKIFVDSLNKKSLVAKDIRKLGEKILKKDFRLRKRLKDRAKLSKKFAKQGKMALPGDRVACKACLPLQTEYRKAKYEYSDLGHSHGTFKRLLKNLRLSREKLNQCLKTCEKDKQKTGQAGSKKPEPQVIPPELGNGQGHTPYEGEDLVHELEKLNKEMAKGACNSAINDISNPILIDMPASESSANKAQSAVGDFTKGAIGGLLGGGGSMFGGGNMFGSRGGGDGARMVNRPKAPWFDFTQAANKVEFDGWVYKPRSKKKKPEIRIAQRIVDSPDDSSPHMMLLQNKDGRILRPFSYMIFELWKHWKLTITITRDTWVNGVHTSHSVSRESSQWSELAERYKLIMQAPGIWEQFGLSPFGKLKGIVAQFPLPENFNPAEWTLISHNTTKTKMFGKEVIKTIPFVLHVAQGKKNTLKFEPSADAKTAYQSAHDCRSLNEIMHDLMSRYDSQLSALNESGNTQKKPTQYKLKQIKKNAENWARILVLQPKPVDQWLNDYQKLSQKVQLHSAIAMADIMLRVITGSGVGVWDSQQWAKDFGRLNEHVRKLAIKAAKAWKSGISKKQQSELSRAYSKLSPNLQQVFQREFVYTLGMNLFLDLR